MTPRQVVLKNDTKSGVWSVLSSVLTAHVIAERQAEWQLISAHEIFELIFGFADQFAKVSAAHGERPIGVNLTPS